MDMNFKIYLNSVFFIVSVDNTLSATINGTQIIIV